jgi:hypothetical protein
LEKAKLNSIPCDVNVYSTSEDSNLLKVKLKVVKTGTNYNGSKFSLDSIKKAEPTLFNIPILGYLKQVDEDSYDYDGHNMITQIVEQPNGYKVTYKYLERPIGVIPESSKVEYVEEDGITYMYCDGYIWKSYANEGLGVILSSDSKGISMEIEVIDGEFDEEDYYFDITDFKYLGITVLGDDVCPAIEGACMVKSDFSSYKAEIERICKEIYSMEHKEGESMSEQVVDNVVDVVEEPIVDEPVVDEPVQDEPIVEDTFDVTDEPVVEEPTEGEVEEPIEEDEEEVEEGIEEPTVEEEPVEEPKVESEFAMFEELVGVVETKEELFEAVKGKMSELANIIAGQNEQITEMQVVVDKFNAMEKERKDAELEGQVEEILAKFSIASELSTPFVEKVKAYEMTVDEFRKEIGYLYAEEQIKKATKFSANKEKEEAEVNIGSDVASSPYGGLGRLINK